MSPDEPRAPSRWEPSLLLSLAGARCRQLVVTVVAGPGGEPLVLVVTVWQRAHRTASPVRGEPREPSRLCCPQTRTAGASVGRLQSATLGESGGHHSASHRLNAVTEMLRQALAHADICSCTGHCIVGWVKFPPVIRSGAITNP